MNGDSMKRTEQKEKRRQKILFAGLDLFIRKGYAATKVTDIAEAVGMSTGLLFHYFASKEQLYEELIKIGLQGPSSVMQMATGLEPLVFFSQAAEQILTAMRTDAFVAKMFVLVTQAMHHEAVPEAVKALLGNFSAVEESVSIIAAGQQQGTIRQGDSLALSVLFWGAISGVAEQVALSPGTPCPEPGWIIDILKGR